MTLPQPPPLPDDPTLRSVAEQLEAQRQDAEIWDDQWRVVYMTSDHVHSITAGNPVDDLGIGEPVYSQANVDLRGSWRASATDETWLDFLAGLAPTIAHDVEGGLKAVRATASPELVARLSDDVDPRPASMSFARVVVKYGNSSRPFHILAIRLYRPDGTFAGTVHVSQTALSASVVSLMGTGDHATMERMVDLMRPARRPGAVMFVDLEGSAHLARSLSTSAYFSLIRRMIFRIDEEIVSRGGIVGKHAGDGASAFFLAEVLGSESVAARECIDAARAIRASAVEIAERSGLSAEHVVIRAGLHWGATLYVGRLLTGGRTEVTGLGDEVNEAARIEACAGGGRILASKSLVERVSQPDADILGVDLAALRYAPLADLPGVTAKATRDAPSIPVCEL